MSKHFIMFYLECSQFLKISCLSWCLFMYVKRKEACFMFRVSVCYLCLWVDCSYVSQMSYHTGHRAALKEWNYLSTLTSVNTITIDSKRCCDIILQNIKLLTGNKNQQWRRYLTFLSLQRGMVMSPEYTIYACWGYWPFSICWIQILNIFISYSRQSKRCQTKQQRITKRLTS